MPNPTPNLKSLFGKLLEHVNADDRDSALSDLCGGDDSLRSELESLLRAHREAGSFLEPPCAATTAVWTEPDPLASASATIGPYKLLEQIGEGGMGTVYVAEQMYPVRRRVALKVIKPGMDSKQVIARFEAERQALALMDHPNIAHVLDANTTEHGRPYFVMELVKGTRITQYCDDHQLTLKQRLELFVPVCAAIQHAHQKGIIHRDLKPSNVLIGIYDGKPVPKVIDFGVAKAVGQNLTDHTMFTAFGTVIGTPEYMSPEQAQLDNVDVDTRADVYALGVLLYELLTGTTPLLKNEIQGVALLEVLRFVREHEPPKPSTRLATTEQRAHVAAKRGLEAGKLSELMRGELDWIVMKCLDKNRGRRYEAANGLAADLQRFLANEPVTACPPSAIYRLRKFAARNRRPLATFGTFAAVAAVGLGIGATLLVRANDRLRASNALLKTNLRLAMQSHDEIMNVVELRAPRRHELSSEDEQILRRALSFYEQFAEANRTNPDVRNELANAYRRAAGAQSGLGQFRMAKDTAKRGIKAREQLAADSPESADILFELVCDRGEYAAILAREGALEASEREVKAAFEILARVNSEKLTLPLHRYYYAHARGHDALAFIARSQGRVTEAKPHQLLSVDFAEKGLSLSDEESLLNYQQLIVLSLGNVGAILYSENQLTESRKFYLQAVDRASAFWGQEAKDPAIALVLTACHRDLSELSKGEEAEEHARRADDLVTRIVEEFPSVPGYRQVLASCLTQHALILRRAGDDRGARDKLQAAIDVGTVLVRQQDDVSHFREELANALVQMANLQRDSGLLEAAEARFTDAIEQLSWLANYHSDQPALGLELAKTHASFGNMLWDFDQTDRAAEQFRAVKTRFERRPPNSTSDWQNEYAAFLVTCPDEHARDVNQARRICEEQIKADPTDARAWSNLGIAHFRSGDWTGAIRAFLRSNELDGSRTVVNGLYRAMSYEQAGNSVDAKAAYCTALASRSPLEAKSADTRRLQRQAEAMLQPESLPTLAVQTPQAGAPLTVDGAIPEATETAGAESAPAKPEVAR